MPNVNAVDVTVRPDEQIDVQVRFDFVKHRFSGGKVGVSGRDYFDWNGKRWKLRCQGFIVDRETDRTTHGVISKASDQTMDIRQDSPLASLRPALERVRAARENHRGWKVSASDMAVKAVFDLRQVYLLPRCKKMGSFASFEYRYDGELYSVQLHLMEEPEPSVKPTAKDWSRGAKAGLPSLGKRR